MAGPLRGRPAQLARAIAVTIAIVVAASVTIVAVLALRGVGGPQAAAVLVLGGSAITLACALGPLLLGLDDPLDLRRFTVFGLPPRPLARALALASLISVPVLCLSAVAVAVGVVWAEHGAPAWSAVLGPLLGALTCVLFARVSFAVSATIFRQRRTRELSGVLFLVLVVVIVPVGVFLASLKWRGTVPPALEHVVEALAASPLGAAWALPSGEAPGGAISFVVAALTLAALWVGWEAVAVRLLTTTERPASVRERVGLGWFAILPGTPTGVIAARSLVYWLRDRRYLFNVVVIPIGAVVAAVPLLVAGVPDAVVALVPVPLIALFLGWLAHNDVAYDSTAIWMHVASGVRGWADRVGRLAPILLIGLPLLAIAVPVSIALHGRWAYAPALTGVAVVLFASALGLSSVTSVLAPYAVARPGDSPFQQPQRSGSSGFVAQAGVLVGSILLSSPVLWWAWLALTEDLAWATSAFWGGLIIGGVVLIAGVAVGSRLFENRGDRLMEFAETA